MKGRGSIAFPVDGQKLRGLAMLLGATLLLLASGFPACAASGEQMVAAQGRLPQSGRVVIRSGLAWMAEDDPLFAMVARALARELETRGLAVVATPPSAPAPLPEGTARLKDSPLPRSKGVRRRIMSVAEAVSRMKAMQLAREGRLPRSEFTTADIRPSARPSSRKATSGNSGQPALTHPEMIRFALSQLEGEPELPGRITVPGRMPDEVGSFDPASADYALVVRFAMLWPASGIPDSEAPSESSSGLAMGWHLLEMDCYDLVPARARTGRPARIWSVAVQRVAFGAYLRGTLPRMARDAVLEAR
jgi:hypothetical protein